MKGLYFHKKGSKNINVEFENCRSNSVTYLVMNARERTSGSLVK